MASHWRRAAGGTTAVIFVVTGVAFLAMVVWGVVLVAQHTVQSVVLGFVVLALGISAVWMRVHIVRARLQAGLNPITGHASANRHA